jgi:hypothetical protein
MVEYVLRFTDRDEIRLADDGGHEVGDSITIADYDWIVESISVPEGAVSPLNSLRLLSPSRDRVARADDDQTLLAELIELMNDSRDGFTAVMPVGEWIDAHLCQASEHTAGERSAVGEQ